MPTPTGDKRIVEILAKKLEIPVASIGAKYDDQNNLISLDLSHLQISQLPAEIGKLTSLQELYLRNNWLSRLPAEIGWLTNLQTLILSSNQLSELPVEIGQLTNLQELDLSPHLPSEISRLTDLKELYQRSNQLTQLPAEIGQLTNLQRLNLGSNQLNRLPPELGRLINLQRLNLGSNQLNRLPPELGRLINLQELNLGYNQLSELPAEIGELTNLQKLALHGDQLSELPPEISKLTNLKELYLGSNRLTQLPAEIGELTNLQKLYLHGNQLTQFPVKINQLTNLQKLGLHDNQLSRLPAEIGQLINLQELELHNNQLSRLPAEIGQLTNLQELNLNSNQLTQLPLEMGQLTNLVWLDLSNNPDLLTPPPEIVSKGTKAVLSFLQELRESGVTRYETKLLVVGEGGAGKSSILRSLRGESFDASLPTTHGIEVNALKLPHPQIPQAEIIFNGWDFGGQHIYHATHQFFLTKRSLYIVVWNARLGAEQGRLAFWLDAIKAVAPDAPVLLVATHTDERAPDLNYQLFKEAYPQLVGNFSVSNKYGTGFEELKTQLAYHASKIGLIGQPWPAKWVGVENALLARKEHHIDIERYTRICAARRVEKKIAQGTLGEYLHDLGKILYFRDDYVLSNMVVLKPNWITKAISFVLEDAKTKDARGILAHADLPRIWATDEEGHTYDKHLYPIFLRLMERFDLSYQIDSEMPNDPTTKSLIPQLLPYEPPANVPAWPQVPTESQVHVEMRYEFDILPAGIMPWFIVRTHRYTQNMHWREGVVLKYQDHTARVELNPIRSELRLVVWGNQPHNFFVILMQTIDLILARFEGLYVERKVPCICHWESEEQSSPCPYFYSYESLDRRMADRKYEVECDKSYCKVSVLKLLYGIHISTSEQVIDDIKRGQEQLLQGQTLISYSQKQILDNSTETLRLLRDLSQLSELILRMFMRQWNFEMQNIEAECPNLFLLTPAVEGTGARKGRVDQLVRKGKRVLNPRNWVSQEYKLYLVCQHPASPHPVGNGYSLREAKDWWRKINPWLNHLVALLKVAIPVTNALGEVYATLDFEQMKNQIALMEEITDTIPHLADLNDLEDAVPDPHLNKDQQVVGSALRVLYSFLDKADPSHAWGGLRKTVTPEGNIFWLCSEHRQQFEPRPLDQRYFG